MSPPESRRFVRVEFHADATLLLGAHRLSVDIDELSLKGATVSVGDAVLPENADSGELHLRIGEDGLEIMMKTVIRNREDNRLGLEWTEIDIDSLGALRRLIELNSGDPGEVRAELSNLSGEQG